MFVLSLVLSIMLGAAPQIPRASATNQCAVTAVASIHSFDQAAVDARLADSQRQIARLRAAVDVR